MACPNCGAACQQGATGNWACGNCGWGSGFVPTMPVPCSHGAETAAGNHARH
jgi:ribosomal protein L37AE/L43A